MRRIGLSSTVSAEEFNQIIETLLSGSDVDISYIHELQDAHPNLVNSVLVDMYQKRKKVAKIIYEMETLLKI